MYTTTHDQEELQFLRQFFESLYRQSKYKEQGAAEILPDISQSFSDDLPNFKGRLAHVLSRAKFGTASAAAVQRAAKDGWRNMEVFGAWHPTLKDAGTRLGIPHWAWS